MKRETPLVSIITPCRNGEEFLPFYFESVLAQTWPNLELYFVDDGSTDHTAQIAERYRSALEGRGIAFFYIYGENKGAAAAINRALGKVKGKYLVWPDSDDTLEPESIALRALFLEEHPEYGFVRSNRRYLEYETKAVRHITRSQSEKDGSADIFFDLINNSTFVDSGCYMLRSELFFSIYPNKAIYETRIGQNWQMLLPMAYFHKCGYINKSLYVVSIRDGSHSRSNRSRAEQYERLMGFEQLLKQILLLCGITERQSIKKTEARNARMMQRFAAAHRESGLFFSQTVRQIKNDGFHLHDAKALVKYCFPFMIPIYRRMRGDRE